jgi:uncharacterized RDD family membrane protein YckC
VRRVLGPAVYAGPVSSQPDTAVGVRTASWGRRILALFIDWTVSQLVVVAVLGLEGWSENRSSGLITMGVFILESTVLTALVGGSFGKLVTGLRVVRLDGSGRPLDLLRSLLRVVLVCLVVPPMIYKPDGRGLHDLAVGTATVPVGRLA